MHACMHGKMNGWIDEWSVGQTSLGEGGISMFLDLVEQLTSSHAAKIHQQDHFPCFLLLM